MNILFILGNGFDLNCGLKSSFNNAYEKYLQNNNDDSENIKKLKTTIKANINTWGDFEMRMAEYAKELNNEDEFIECIDDFLFFLNKYLDNEERIFIDNLSKYNNNKRLETELKYSIYNFYLEFTDIITNVVKQSIYSEDINYNLITFNYTNTIENLTKFLKTDLFSKIIHIHGNIDKEDMLLGIDNEQQLVGLPYKISNKARRHFIKPVFNKEYNTKINETKNIISKSRYICVFGASLGDSDLMWRDELKRWLIEDDSRYLFIYDYKYSSIKCNTKKYVLDYEDIARNEYKNKLNLPDNPNIENRLCIMVGKNIFNYKKLFDNSFNVQITNEF